MSLAFRFSKLLGAMDAEKLKELRKSFGLTQVQFADKLGVHPLTLSRFERGEDAISRLVTLAIRELSRELTAEQGVNGQPDKETPRKSKRKSSKGNSRGKSGSSHPAD